MPRQTTEMVQKVDNKKYNNATGNNQTDNQYKMSENNLEETTSEKDLRIFIENKSGLSNHIDAALNRANRLMGLIRRSYEHLDGDSLVQLYI